MPPRSTLYLGIASPVVTPPKSYSFAEKKTDVVAFALRNHLSQGVHFEPLDSYEGTYDRGSCKDFQKAQNLSCCCCLNSWGAARTTGFAGRCQSISFSVASFARFLRAWDPTWVSIRSVSST